MSVTVHKSFNSDSKLEKSGIYIGKVKGWKELTLIIITHIVDNHNKIIDCFYLGVPINIEKQIINHELTRYIKLPDYDGTYNHFQINIKDLYHISEIKECVPYVIENNFFKVKSEILDEWCKAANSGQYYNIEIKEIN